MSGVSHGQGFNIAWGDNGADVADVIEATLKRLQETGECKRAEDLLRRTLRLMKARERV